MIPRGYHLKESDNIHVVVLPEAKVEQFVGVHPEVAERIRRYGKPGKSSKYVGRPCL